jgi:hypothetical protein
MRLTVSFVALAAAALSTAACKKSEPVPEPTAAATATTAQVPGGLAIDGLPNAGVFEVTHASGKKWTTTVTADGKTSTVKDGKTILGTWTSTGPGNYCDTVDGKTTCYKEEIVNGVYTSTNEADPKDTSTIRRLASATTPPGLYEVTDKDGKPAGTTQINADGSYKDTPPTGLPVAGLITYKDGKTCFDPSGPKDGPECWTESARAADGSFTATSDEGETVSVKPKVQ